MSTRLWNSSLFRYITTGVLTVITDIVVLIILRQILRVEVYIAATISFSLSLLVNFLLNKYWSFGAYAHTLRQVVMYGSLVLINYFLSLSFIAFASHFGVNYIIGKVLALMVTTIWNYIIYKKVIFV